MYLCMSQNELSTNVSHTVGSPEAILHTMGKRILNVQRNQDRLIYLPSGPERDCILQVIKRDNTAIEQLWQQFDTTTKEIVA